MPMCMTRLVVESGWRMTGGAAQVGSVGTTVARRSWTTCRAWMRSVPRSKISSTDESCGTERRADLVQAGHAVERLLERDGHELLGLLGGEPEADRLDLDARRRELREGVHARVPAAEPAP